VIVSPPAPPLPTPRAQLGRVVIGAVLGLVLGAGPALAWDLSASPPRKRPLEAQNVGQPSVWRGFGRSLHQAAKAVAHVYLPEETPPPTVDSVVVPPPTPTVAVIPLASTVPTPTPPSMQLTF
jgi:hypothetical protein